MKTRRMWLGVLITLFTSVVCANAQERLRERSIRRLPVEQTEPVGMTQVKVNDLRVLANKVFVADDDWLKGLVISVKNRSNKLILFVSIQLQFPRPGGLQERFSVFDLSHGNSALQVRPPTPEERLTGIAPGDTVELRLSEQRYLTLHNSLHDKLLVQHRKGGSENKLSHL